MTKRTFRRTLGASALAVGAAALLLVGAAGIAQAAEVANEGRNFDAREQLNALASVEPAASQIAAIAKLQQQLSDLGVELDPAMGTTRTLYNQVGNLTKPAHGDPMDLALEFVRGNIGALGISEADLTDYEVTDVVYSQVTGATHIYLRQTYAGLSVYNGQLQVNVNRDGQIMSVNNAFVADIANAVNTLEPVIDPAAAVGALADQLGISVNVQRLSKKASDSIDQETLLAADGLAVNTIKARLMWLPVAAGDTRLVWHFHAETPDSNHMFDTTVDAVTGDVWTRFDFVASDSYRVYAQPVESPIHTSPLPPSDARTVVSNPADSTASPSGWFNSGGTIMDGNNVHACADANANNSCDTPQPSCGSSQNCDFTINLSSAPSNSIPAAIANLFYWNNVIHDIQYQYGFDEQAGNFQENNFGRGGAGSDSVNADAQDGSGNCNANFGTPADGGNPRMQMFTCNRANPSRDGDYDNGVIVHEYGHGISNRQVGGPSQSGCLGNAQQAGEGWSDWFGLVYTAKASDTGPQARGIGAYLFNEPAAGGTIRDLPYSTSSSVNNWTYQSISGASIPHGVGSRWAQAIWEVYWALVDEHGFEGDLLNFNASDPNEAGNKRALFYVNEGLKNTACSPTFTQNRDGIIQVATNSFGGEDVCLLWEAFAAFGLGTNAVSGGSGSTNPTNGFNIPASCDDPPPPPPTCDDVLHSADFEGSSDGWFNSSASTCSTGDFVSGSPTQVTNGGVVTQVAGAASGSGAWFTATNSSAGVNDVDGGTCDTRSPSVAAAAGQVSISFDYFHGQRDAGGDSADGFVVDVLNNGSVVQTIVNIGDTTSNASWTQASTTVNLASAGNLQLRVRATDGTASGDLIEGGIDNVLICGGEGDPPPPGGCTLDDDFENGATGWSNSASSTCSTGAYVLATPTQQTSTIVTQPNGDHTSGSGNAIFTATNSSAGVNDVDGGQCILDSPTWSVANASTLSVWYFHGQRDTGGDPSGDFFRIEVSTNGGSSYTPIVNIGDVRTVANWTNATASIPAGSNVRLRVRSSDGTSTGDIVEGGIDDLSICDN